MASKKMTGGRGFNTAEEEAKKRADSVRKAAALNLATEKEGAFVNALDDILGVGGAVVGGYFGGPAGAKAGYEAGSTVGGMFGNKETDHRTSEEVKSEISGQPSQDQLLKQAQAKKKKETPAGLSKLLKMGQTDGGGSVGGNEADMMLAIYGGNEADMTDPLEGMDAEILAALYG